MAYNKLPTKQSSSKWKQGLYILKENSKYLGDTSKIIYRSSLEYRMMVYLDNTEKVHKWASELVSIQYIQPELQENGEFKNVQHTYHIDFYAEIKNPDNPTGMDKLLIEVKPHDEYFRLVNNTPPPKPRELTPKKLKNWKYALEEFNKNKHKWLYAQEYAKLRGMRFVVVTEQILEKMIQ